MFSSAELPRICRRRPQPRLGGAPFAPDFFGLFCTACCDVSVSQLVVLVGEMCNRTIVSGIKLPLRARSVARSVTTLMISWPMMADDDGHDVLILGGWFYALRTPVEDEREGGRS